jgi:hypothetical protein
LLGQVAELTDKREDACSWYAGISEEDEHWFDAQTRQAVVLDSSAAPIRRSISCVSCRLRPAKISPSSASVYLLEADLLARAKGALKDALAV